MKGIMQITYNQYLKDHKRKWKSVRYITTQEIHDIYYNLYYLPSGCDTLPPALSLIHLDASINFGIYGAKKLLMKSIDGFYDPILDKEMALNYIETRKLRRYEIVHKNPSKRKYLKGWLNRDNKLAFIINKYY